MLQFILNIMANVSVWMLAFVYAYFALTLSDGWVDAFVHDNQGRRNRYALGIGIVTVIALDCVIMVCMGYIA